MVYMKFNSGRGYGANGQMIYASAELGPGEVYNVVFYDATRMIIGQFHDVYFSQDTIMQVYDSNLHRSLTFSDERVRDIIQHFQLRP